MKDQNGQSNLCDPTLNEMVIIGTYIDGDKAGKGSSMWIEAYSSSIQVPMDLVTRVRAKKFKETFNGLIQVT